MKYEYSDKELDSYFFTLKGLYFFYMPLRVPYSKIKNVGESKGYKLKGKLKIIELSKAFGNGWIGIEVEKAEGENIQHIQGKFKMYEHVGSYKTLGKSYRKIMQDYPNVKEFYNIYLNVPGEVEEKDLITQIIWK